MFDLLLIVSIVYSVVQVIKESFASTIPAENWENKELYHNDIMNGVPIEQCMKNLENGKYKLKEPYPEPHRDAVSGKIIIDNCELYYEDVKNFGAYKAMLWMEQGKYNLTPEEIKAKEERIKAEYEYMCNLANR